MIEIRGRRRGGRVVWFILLVLALLMIGAVLSNCQMPLRCFANLSPHEA